MEGRGKTARQACRAEMARGDPGTRSRTTSRRLAQGKYNTSIYRTRPAGWMRLPARDGQDRFVAGVDRMRRSPCRRDRSVRIEGTQTRMTLSLMGYRESYVRPKNF